MKGVGFFYSRGEESELIGDFFTDSDVNSIFMQEDYGEIFEENHIPISSLESKIFNELQKKVYDIEKSEKMPVRGIFKIEDNKTSILDFQNANLKGKSKVRSLLNMYKDSIINLNDLVRNISLLDINNLFTDEIDFDTYDGNKLKLVVPIYGESGNRGVAYGRLVSDKNEVLNAYKKGEKVIYITEKAGPEDVIVMKKSAGVIMTKADPTSHPVILARSNNIPCVINTPDLKIGDKGILIENLEKILFGQEVTIDGTQGNIYGEKLNIRKNLDIDLLGELNSIFKRKCRIKVYSNSDSGEEFNKAKELGSDGIGLCRTEHMLFDDSDKINSLRSVLLSTNVKENLNDFISYQKKDFDKIFSNAKNERVVIRLIDPPLNEFLPTSENDLSQYLQYSGLSMEKYESIKNSLDESSGHFGIRGVRLGLLNKEVYVSQLEAILASAKSNKINEVNVLIPFISFRNEFLEMKRILKSYSQDSSPEIKLNIGAMIETPMSAFESDFYSRESDFLSYGLNDLTMATYALERVGSDQLLGKYIDAKIIESSPFEKVDYEPMQNLLRESIDKARGANKDITIGICSEQVNNFETINFLSKLSIDYISSTVQNVPLLRYNILRSNL